ncbi:MAG: hypothetical protein ACJ8AT_20225 [Hyalangium sp.]|uniref:hypothetical protein n=1 Tax=Hyalangium sp. TaxID=2028555 RepID=UPI00389AA2BD
MALLAGKLSAWAAVLALTASPTKTDSAAALKQRADQLAREARALAKPAGCKQVEECEVAGFGHKACGGPREYIAYCSRTTDVKALQGKLAELEQAEQAWQQEAHIMSNCGLTRRPLPRLEAGECRAR